MYQLPSPVIFLLYLPKTIIKNKEKAAFRKMIVFNSCSWVYVSTGCLPIKIYPGNGTLREQSIALGWEERTKLSVKFASSTVKGRKSLGSTH